MKFTNPLKRFLCASPISVSINLIACDSEGEVVYL